MRFRVLALLLATLACFTGPATAVIGTSDDIPAATLLLPYFEVDPNNVGGTTTLFTIRNTDAASVVAHVTVWSNLSVPILTFDVYLTGFDQQAINMRDVAMNGLLPMTGPSDFLSPRGDRSGPHNNFGGTCSTSPGQAPAYTNPALSPSMIAHVRASLSGQPSALFGGCAGTPTDHLVGYVTIDATNRCSLLFPSAAGYFVSGGQGVASNRNVLSGDWTLVDPASNFAHADTLVHLEASASDPRTSTPGSYTFYGRYTDAAADNRERLPARWNAPLDPLHDALDGQPTELLVWRDSGRVITSFNCASLPAAFPLGSTEISAVSQEGLATPLAADSFPWETQRVAIDQAGSSLRLDLDTVTGSTFDPAKQAYVLSVGRSPIASTTLGAVQAAGTGAIGTADPAPGASLLLPYFEVDPGNPTGVWTALSVRNGSPAPVLARVVLWTDSAIPTLGFDLYLPGHGSRIVDLREIFGTGVLPASGPAPLPGCAGVLPSAPLSPATLAALGAAHTGASSQLFGGLCAGASHGDGVARGYLTVDVMNQCTGALPGQPGYFGAGGAAGFDNVLWGEYVLVEPEDNLAHGDTLVHLQASTTDPLTTSNGRTTFYGRQVAWTAADHREPLSQLWGVGSRDAGAFNGGASLLVWRDSGQVHQPFACGSPPGTFPLDQGFSLHFDEQAQDVPVPPFALGLETQKRPVDWDEGPLFGWLSLNLEAKSEAFPRPTQQSYVTVLERATGRFGVSIPAVQFPNGIFVDGFESGGFVMWSSKAP
jgi:hypothetical protein